MECKHDAIALHHRQYTVCRSPSQTREERRSEQQRSPSHPRSYYVSFTVAVSQAAAYLWMHGLGAISCLTSLVHVPQAMPTAQFGTRWFACLSILLQEGRDADSQFQTSRGTCMMERPGSGKAIEFAFLNGQGVEKSLLAMTGRYLPWSIWSVVGFYNGIKWGKMS